MIVINKMNKIEKKRYKLLVLDKINSIIYFINI